MLSSFARLSPDQYPLFLCHLTSGHIHVEALIPVRVQRPLADRCRLGLLAIDGGDGERIGETCVVSVNPVVRRVSQRRSARACTRRV